MEKKTLKTQMPEPRKDETMTNQIRMRVSVLDWNLSLAHSVAEAWLIVCVTALW